MGKRFAFYLPAILKQSGAMFLNKSQIDRHIDTISSNISDGIKVVVIIFFHMGY